MFVKDYRHPDCWYEKAYDDYGWKECNKVKLICKRRKVKKGDHDRNKHDHDD